MTLLVTIINFYIKSNFLIHFLQLFWFLASNFGTFSQPYSCQFQKHIFWSVWWVPLDLLRTNYLHKHAVLKYKKIIIWPNLGSIWRILISGNIENSFRFQKLWSLRSIMTRNLKLFFFTKTVIALIFLKHKIKAIR